MATVTNVLEDLRERGLVVQTTDVDELSEHLGSDMRTVYCGFDPTADSLHIGSLVPLLALRRFQLAGHRPIALVGGATGLVGDPSFKAAERNLNTEDTVVGWTKSIHRQVSAFLDTEGENGALVVNNIDWFGEYGLLDFLRDVGKLFSVNSMIQKESVRQRIEREGEGISFAEFSYSLLQGYDFAALNKRYDCSLQIGGSDQWGNITGGLELCRRLNRSQAHALTFPLVTKADGTKFGKTETGTIWLDPAKTSPYAFYQFWINCADADVYRFLGYFTFLSPAEIEAIRVADAERAGRPEAQSILATEVTRIVHGDAGVDAARRITDALFSGDSSALSEQDMDQLKQDGLPYTALNDASFEGASLTSLLGDSMGVPGKQVKDALARGAVLINGDACASDANLDPAACFAPERSAHGRFYLVRVGKKKYQLFERVAG